MPNVAVSSVLNYVRRYLNDVIPGGAVAIFVDEETPTGTINGSNKVFSTAVAPSPGSSTYVFLDGQLMTPTVDYSLSGGTITFVTAPIVGQVILVSYRY